MVAKRSAFPFVHAPREAVTVAMPRSRQADGLSQRFALALQLLEDGQWDDAFVELSALADSGHPAAARIALTMVIRGRSLFGGHFSASREARLRWQRHGEA